MVVGYQPGGSIRDALVVLKFDEKLPGRYNVPNTTVYREAEQNPREWILVKRRYQTLPVDSQLLSQPEVPEVEIFPLTTDAKDAIFEHIDIIRFEESKDEDVKQ